MIRLLSALLLFVGATAFAHSGDHEEGITHDPKTGEHVKAKRKRSRDADEKGPFDKGRFVFRGGANLDLNRSINLGGNNDGDTPVNAGASVGVGYFVIDNLSLDLDLDAHLELSPEFGFASLGFTPGARYQLIPQAYVRVGAPLIVYPSFNAGILGGVGYHQPIGSKAALVIGLDYTYYFTEEYRTAAPQGRVDVNAGVQTWF